MLSNCKRILILLALGSSVGSGAQNFKTSEPVQNFYFIETNGRPLLINSQYNTDGSPFYYEEYAWADLISMNGQSYNGILVKFNISEKQIQFINPAGTEMIAGVPIKKIRLLNVIREDGSVENITLESDTGALNDPAGNVYQVLDSGKISLVKKIDISYSDEKPYGQASVTRHFTRKESDYIILPGGEYKKLEKNKSFITEALKDKEKQVAVFIETNNIKCKSTKDFQKIISYYNSLN